MGLKEAETLLAARPEMNTPYLNRFVDMKVGQMTSHLQTGEGPKNRGDVQSDYAHTNVDNQVSKEPMSVVAHNANKEGLGEAFNIAPVSANKVNEKFSHIENQIEEQKELIDQQGQERKLVSHHKLGIK